jgi:hypothetical protein
VREHTRAEGSVFFLRIKNGVGYVPPPATGLFTDVDTSAWYAPWVEAAYVEGLLPACQDSPLQFCPEDPLNRAWAAYMMVMAKGLTLASTDSAQAAAPTSTPAPDPSSTPTQTGEPTEIPSVTPMWTETPIPSVPD